MCVCLFVCVPSDAASTDCTTRWLFGLWFGAYAEALVDDTQQLFASYNITNQNPLGSAAGYGSSFPLDRDYTTELLEFKGMNVNVVYAQMGRGKVEQSVSFALASLAQTINKLSC